MDGQVQQPNEGEVKNPGEVKVETQQIGRAHV